MLAREYTILSLFFHILKGVFMKTNIGALFFLISCSTLTLCAADEELSGCKYHEYIHPLLGYPTPGQPKEGSIDSGDFLDISDDTAGCCCF